MIDALYSREKNWFTDAVPMKVGFSTKMTFKGNDNFLKYPTNSINSKGDKKWNSIIQGKETK